MSCHSVRMLCWIKSLLTYLAWAKLLGANRPRGELTKVRNVHKSVIQWSTNTSLNLTLSANPEPLPMQYNHASPHIGALCTASSPIQTIQPIRQCNPILGDMLWKCYYHFLIFAVFDVPLWCNKLLFCIYVICLEMCNIQRTTVYL